MRVFVFVCVCVRIRGSVCVCEREGDVGGVGGGRVAEGLAESGGTQGGRVRISNRMRIEKNMKPRRLMNQRG